MAPWCTSTAVLGLPSAQAMALGRSSPLISRSPIALPLLQTHLLGAAVAVAGLRSKGFQASLPFELGCFGDDKAGRNPSLQDCAVS